MLEVLFQVNGQGLCLLKPGTDKYCPAKMESVWQEEGGLRRKRYEIVIISMSKNAKETCSLMYK